MDVDFTLRAAIRSCDGELDCPDEDAGCPGTKWVLCALDAAPDSEPIAQQISFLGCWDEQSGEDWELKARHCARGSRLDFSKISACNSGSRGTDLQKAASDAYHRKFPDRTCDGIFGVPDVEINGAAQENTDYEDLLGQLCAALAAAGSEADACRSQAEIV